MTGPAGAKNARATSPIDIFLSVPITVNVPALNSISPGAASISAAAISLPRAMTASAATRSALPPTSELRAAKVPRPNATFSVSPWM